MSQTLALAEVLTFAFLASASPFPIIALMPILTSDRRAANAPALLAGWMAGLTIALGTMLLFLHLSGFDSAADTEPRGWVLGVRIGLACGLFVLAAKQWKSRPRADEPMDPPAWLASIAAGSVSRTFVTGLLLAAANPKIVLFALGAAAAMMDADLALVRCAMLTVVFVLVATMGPLTPVVITIAMGSRADAVLARLRTWLERNSPIIMAALFTLLGGKVLYDAVAATGWMA